MKKIVLFLVPFLLVFQFSCKKETLLTEFNADHFAKDFAEIIVIPNYNNLNHAADVLNQLSIEFNQNPTDSILHLIKDQWKITRQHWELTESFLFGPVANLEIDPSIDDWPLNNTDLDSVMANNSNITVPQVSDFPTSLKGFHAIEYLVFGKNGHKIASEFTEKEFQYLVALTQVLHNQTNILFNSWQNSGNSYYNEWITAGNGSTIYSSKQSAALELVTAIGGIIAEVGGEKISSPFLSYDSTLEESRYSRNSFVDFTNNLIGAKNAYLCSFEGKTGVSLSEFVKSYNKSLNDNVIRQFDFVIDNLKSYQIPFSQSIFLERAQLESTIVALDQLAELMNNNVYQLVLQKFK